MSQKVDKLCSCKGCRSDFDEKGSHDYCPNHSACFDHDLAVYLPSNCDQCQNWISLLKTAPTEGAREVARDKLASWVAKIQKLRRERHLPGNVVRNKVLYNLIYDIKPFGSDYADDVRVKVEEQSSLDNSPLKSKRFHRSRLLIISDDSDEDEPPEKKIRSRSSSESSDDPPEKKIRSRSSSESSDDLPEKKIRSRFTSESSDDPPEKKIRSRSSSESSDDPVQLYSVSSPTESNGDFVCSSPMESTGNADFGSPSPMESTGNADFGSPSPMESTGNADFGSSSPIDSTGNADFVSSSPMENKSDDVELPSLEEMAKTMRWLVQSVGNIQQVLLQKHIVPSDEWLQSDMADAYRAYAGLELSKDPQLAAYGEPSETHGAIKREIVSSRTEETSREIGNFEMERCNSRYQDEIDEEENISQDLWIPLPDDFRLDTTGPVPRVSVPVRNGWQTLSTDRCKVQFRNTVPFIKYVLNIDEDGSLDMVTSSSEGDKFVIKRDEESKSFERDNISRPVSQIDKRRSSEKDKLNKIFVDFAEFSMKTSNDFVSQQKDVTIGPKDFRDNWLVIPVKDTDILASGYFDYTDSLWTKYIEGNDTKFVKCFSFMNVIFDRENMNSIHTALSAPQIGVEDTARLLKFDLKRLPSSSYREEKNARNHLLKLMSSIQAFQLLLSSLKDSMVSWGEMERMTLEGFLKAVEAPMLTLESSFKSALLEFFRLRKSLRQKLFHGCKSSVDVAELLKSSPFSEGLFPSSAVTKFLSQLRQKNLAPVEVMKKKKRTPKKVVFSKKYFALPKRKLNNKSGRGNTTTTVSQKRSKLSPHSKKEGRERMHQKKKMMKESFISDNCPEEVICKQERCDEYIEVSSNDEQ